MRSSSLQQTDIWREKRLYDESLSGTRTTQFVSKQMDGGREAEEKAGESKQGSSSPCIGI